MLSFVPEFPIAEGLGGDSGDSSMTELAWLDNEANMLRRGSVDGQSFNNRCMERSTLSAVGLSCNGDQQH